MSSTTPGNQAMKHRQGHLGCLSRPLSARVLRPRLSRAREETAYLANRLLHGLALLTILALLSSTVYGQAATGRVDLEDFLESIRPTSASPRDVGLTVVDHHLSPDGRKLTLTLRNNHWKDITAWSLSRSHGTSAGAGFIGRSGEDAFYEIAANPEAPMPGIASGESIDHTLHFSEPIDLSPDRFHEGNFDVLVVSLGGVIFNDGTYAGEDVGFLRNAFAGRVRYIDEAQALLETLDDLGSDATARHRFLAELGSRENLTPHEQTLRHTYERLRANLGRDAPRESVSTVRSWLNGAVNRGHVHLPRNLRQSLSYRRSR